MKLRCKNQNCNKLLAIGNGNVQITIKGKMMLSINDHADIRALFAGLNMTECQLAYSVGRLNESRVPRRELVICNY